MDCYFLLKLRSVIARFAIFATLPLDAAAAFSLANGIF